MLYTSRIMVSSRFRSLVRRRCLPSMDEAILRFLQDVATLTPYSNQLATCRIQYSLRTLMDWCESRWRLAMAGKESMVQSTPPVFLFSVLPYGLLALYNLLSVEKSKNILTPLSTTDLAAWHTGKAVATISFPFLFSHRRLPGVNLKFQSLSRLSVITSLYQKQF